jgi:hypothetical protein
MSEEGLVCIASEVVYSLGQRALMCPAARHGFIHVHVCLNRGASWHLRCSFSRFKQYYLSCPLHRNSV